MNHPNIAFVGKPGAGKSTAATLLQTQFDLGYQTISFAQPIKIMLDTKTDRARLQEFGTDIVRRYEPLAWVRLFQWQLDLRTQLRRQGLHVRSLVDEPRLDQTVRWANDDCRALNELQALQDMGWKVIEVKAPYWVRVDRLLANGKLGDASELDHEIELGLDYAKVADFTIANVGSENYLVAAITNALETWANE